MGLTKIWVSQRFEIAIEVDAKSGAEAKRMLDSIDLQLKAQKEIDFEYEIGYYVIKPAKFERRICDECGEMTQFRMRAERCYLCDMAKRKKEREESEAK
jgi:hypothetical protein